MSTPFNFRRSLWPALASLGFFASSARSELIGEWRFNESGVIATDSSNNKLDLTLRRDTASSFDAHTDAGTGVSGSPDDHSFDPCAWPYHQNGNAVALGVIPPHFALLSQFTISVWVKIAKVPAQGPTLFLFNGTTIDKQSIKISFHTKGDMGGGLIEAGSLLFNTKPGWLTPADIGKWVNLAVTFDCRLPQAAIKVYRGDTVTPIVEPFSQGGNGVKTGPIDNTAPVMSAVNGLIIGNSPECVRTWVGCIDDVRVFNTALTPAELETVRQMSLSLR